MYNRLSIIICSKEESNEKKDFIEKVVSTCEVPADVLFVTNKGGSPLSTVYHDYMSKATNDIVVFIHDDIEFLKSGWGKEVLRLFEQHKDYGIIGVAGSAEFHEEAAWWRFKRIYGQVLHRHEGKSWLTSFSPLLGKDLEEVCVIDGLFMAVEKKRISKEFSTDLDAFDFYDIDFCLANYLDGKCKIGVTTNIRVAHNSIGQMRDSWYINREKVNNKYNKYYPIYVKDK